MNKRASIIIISAVLAVFVAVGAYTATTKGAVGLTYDAVGNLLTTLGSGTAGPMKLEDETHTSGDAGVFAMGVVNSTVATSLAGAGDYVPFALDTSGRLGIRGSYEEDQGHTNAHVGVFVMSVRDDDPPSTTAGASGDYAAFSTDDNGRLWTNAGRHSTTTATIADSASLSDEFVLGSFKYLAIALPSGWTTASMTFQCASASGGTFQNLYDDAGAEVTIASTAASLTVAVDLLKNALASCVYLKIRSGTAGSPTAQAGGDVITFILKE